MRSHATAVGALKRSLKPLVWATRGAKGPSRFGLILGSQRSGTNMMNDAFDRDWNCMAFGEDSGLALGTSFGPHSRWRWRPLEEVASTLDQYQAPLLIAKPIVESQRVRELMKFFPSAKIIWAYRHYQDVAQSSIVKFGWDASLHNLTSVLNPELRSHWFSENLSDETRAVVTRYFDPARSLPDSKALRATSWSTVWPVVWYEMCPLPWNGNKLSPVALKKLFCTVVARPRTRSCVANRLVTHWKVLPDTATVVASIVTQLFPLFQSEKYYRVKTRYLAAG